MAKRTEGRRPRGFLPGGERFESRLLMSAGLPRPHAFVRPLTMPGFTHPTRPSTPVLPYASVSTQATFLDPTVRILGGNRMVVGPRSYIAPYATLDARGGAMKIGRLSSIGDNATLASGPSAPGQLTELVVGDAVDIGPGAQVLGSSVVGAFDALAQPTYVGANATVDSAVVEPGAFVMPLAYVAPGVVIRSGVKVLPGAVVTTQAQADDPSQGLVAQITAADRAGVQNALSDASLLASGYTSLYQGISSTGASPGTNTSGIYNGNLAIVSGVGPAPSITISGKTLPRISPEFPAPRGVLVASNLPVFPARITGQAVFAQRASQVAHAVGRSDSIRADVGRPIVFGPIGRIGNFVTIHAPRSGHLLVGANLQVADRAVIVGGPTAAIGDNVSIGEQAVVANSTLGNGVVVGPRSYLSGVTVPAGTVIPAGTILIG